jgi:hypothetical protein
VSGQRHAPTSICSQGKYPNIQLWSITMSLRKNVALFAKFLYRRHFLYLNVLHDTVSCTKFLLCERNTPLTTTNKQQSWPEQSLLYHQPNGSRGGSLQPCHIVLPNIAVFHIIKILHIWHMSTNTNNKTHHNPRLRSIVTNRYCFEKEMEKSEAVIFKMGSAKASHGFREIFVKTWVFCMLFFVIIFTDFL